MYQATGGADSGDSATRHLPFHGAKVAILVGDSLVTILRDDIPTIPWPGYWDLPGGARDPGETAVQTVIRECDEELGLHVTDDRLAWGAPFSSPPSSVWFFVCEWPDFDPALVTFGGEGQRWALAPVEWFLTRARSIPQHRQRLAAYLARRDAVRRSVVRA